MPKPELDDDFQMISNAEAAFCCLVLLLMSVGSLLYDWSLK